jgi:hypothetical protein
MPKKQQSGKPSASKFYLSYCGSDQGFADVLQTRLRDAQIGVVTREDLPDAAWGWSPAVDEVIRTSLGVIVICSPAALTAVYVNYDWAFAAGAGVQVIAVLRDVPAEALHPRLRAAMTFDHMNIEDLTRALDEIDQLNNVQVVRAAKKLIEAGNRAERARGVALLQTSRHPSAVELLARVVTQYLGTNRADVSMLAGLALANKTGGRDVRALPGLEAGLTEFGTRWKSVVALSKMDAPQVVDLLDGLLKTVRGDRMARLLAIRGLVRHDGLRAVPTLLGLLQAETDSEIMIALAEVLSTLHVVDAIPLLEQAMQRLTTQGELAWVKTTQARIQRTLDDLRELLTYPKVPPAFSRPGEALTPPVWEPIPLED